MAKGQPWLGSRGWAPDRLALGELSGSGRASLDLPPIAKNKGAMDGAPGFVGGDGRERNAGILRLRLRMTAVKECR